LELCDGKRGRDVALLGGSLVATQRRTGQVNRPKHWGKHHRHGLHLLAPTDDRGRLIWISSACPGCTHDVTAARRDHLLTHLRDAGLGASAGLGFLGLDHEAGRPHGRHGLQGPRAHELTSGRHWQCISAEFSQGFNRQ